MSKRPKIIPTLRNMTCFPVLPGWFQIHVEIEDQHGATYRRAVSFPENGDIEGGLRRLADQIARLRRQPAYPKLKVKSLMPKKWRGKYKVYTFLSRDSFAITPPMLGKGLRKRLTATQSRPKR